MFFNGKAVIVVDIHHTKPIILIKDSNDLFWTHKDKLQFQHEVEV